MRKHTGQYYHCKHCDFRSVNKSHLVEHEATHDKKRHLCAICQKDYATGEIWTVWGQPVVDLVIYNHVQNQPLLKNAEGEEDGALSSWCGFPLLSLYFTTGKSLINHVRKYHSNSRKGQQYLQTFLQGRQASGSTVIHQCHVCNRKVRKDAFYSTSWVKGYQKYVWDPSKISSASEQLKHLISKLGNHHETRAGFSVWSSCKYLNNNGLCWQQSQTRMITKCSVPALHQLSC